MSQNSQPKRLCTSISWCVAVFNCVSLFATLAGTGVVAVHGTAEILQVRYKTRNQGHSQPLNEALATPGYQN
eukprot:2548129-Amphidinium_carterae.1